MVLNKITIEQKVILMKDKIPILEIVDKNDNLIDFGSKEYVHKEGVLHRAFSIFIYNCEDKTVLIQKRALSKYHSGGLWSNSCCSHKYQNESWKESISRCLKDELSFFINDDKSEIIRFVGTFYYFSDYGYNKEHEIDHVFVIALDTAKLSQILPNPDEIMELKWMTIGEIDMALKTKPSSFTSWFSEAYAYFRSAVLDGSR